MDVQPTNLQQLCDAIMSIWTKISEECLQHLVESMPWRIKVLKGVQPGTSKVYLIKWPVSVNWEHCFICMVNFMDSIHDLQYTGSTLYNKNRKDRFHHQRKGNCSFSHNYNFFLVFLKGKKSDLWDINYFLKILRLHLTNLTFPSELQVTCYLFQNVLYQETPFHKIIKYTYSSPSNLGLKYSAETCWA